MILETDVCELLKTAMSKRGLKHTIYDSGKPTSSLPDVYVDLMNNGGIKTSASRLGIGSGNLLVALNVKLLSNSTPNKKKMAIAFGEILELFKDNSALVEKNATFTLNLSAPTVFEGVGLASGYYTKTINLNFKIVDYV